MSSKQAIPNPTGITVMGSAVIHVEPDVAQLHFTVSRTAEHPKEAFQAARGAAHSVRAFLDQAGIEEVASSRIRLHQAYEYGGSGRQSPKGYEAEVRFNVVLRDLNRMEDILTGVVDAGANEIDYVALQTDRLREMRAEARRLAIESAREKAGQYASAAGVAVGPVIHIEDLRPEEIEVSGRQQQLGVTFEPEYEGQVRAFDPGSIRVAGGVMVSYALLERHN